MAGHTGAAAEYVARRSVCGCADDRLRPAGSGAVSGELGTELGYDLYVKDRPDGEEWVCYDSLPDDVRLDMDGVEREMAGVLDREVQRRGLSYTKCPFERVEGKTRVAKKPEMAEPQMGM